MGEWIETHKGFRFDLDAPQPDQVSIEDIAHSLARLCRWNGHTRDFYSVAQHSIIVATRLPQELQLQGLLHDAHEAYMGDIAQPVKNILNGLSTWGTGMDDLEWRVIAVVRAALGLDELLDDRVATVDMRLAMTEKEQLISPGPVGDWDTDLYAWTPYEDMLICPWPPKAAEHAFRQAYEVLIQDPERNIS